jgi:NTE family protein
MPRVGLVLGAGGIVGQAYHAGVLAALELDLGWDPRSADLIVGSSAGSITGTGLRLGVPAHDLAAWAVNVPLSEEGAAVQAALGGSDPPEVPPFDVRRILRPWRWPSTALLARVARRPWAFRPAVAALTLLPSGHVDIAALTAVIDDACGDQWPDGLWICAARRDDGARVVFGRDGAPSASLAAAVAASCSIPGYFKPVRINGVQYFDGGVHSPTNADVLRDEALDLVIVVSPMSAAHGRSFSTLFGPMRWTAHNRLDHEVRRLRAAGTEVVRIEPSPKVLAAMGVNAMADDRSERVVQAAFFDTGRYIATPRIARRLAPIAAHGRGSRDVA